MGGIGRLACLALLAWVWPTGLAPSGAAWAQEAAAASEAAPTIPVSRSFRVQGAVATPKTYTLQDLRAAPITTEAVFFSTGAGPVSATFKGVLLWTLLKDAGIRTDPAVKNDILRRTVAVVGSDGYQVVLSAGEIDPMFGGALAIVAYNQDGRLLGPDGGFARLIVPGDQAGGRNVSSIVRIEVR